MADGSMNEFSIYRTADDTEWEVSFPSNTRLKGQILRLDKKHPGKVGNLTVNKDGSIFATIPLDWVKIHPTRTVSEEQRAKSRERAKAFFAKGSDSQTERNGEKRTEMP